MNNIINIAKNIAYEAHQNQTRKHYNLPYMVHIERVIGYVNSVFTTDKHLLECGDDYDYVIAAAILHDVLEDCPDWTYGRLQAEGIPSSILDMVDALTKLSIPTYQRILGKKNITRAERKKIENERLAKSSKYVKIIKLADRYDNIQDLIVAFFRKQIDKKYFLLYLSETQELLEYIWVDCKLTYTLKTVVNDAKYGYLEEKHLGNDVKPCTIDCKQLKTDIM